MHFIYSLPMCPPLAGETLVSLSEENLLLRRTFLIDLENEYDQISLSDPSFVSSRLLSSSLIPFCSFRVELRRQTRPVGAGRNDRSRCVD